MHSHQLYLPHRPPKPDTDEALFHKRKAVRPSSAKANQTPVLKKQQRPSSASRGQDATNLNRVPSHYEPDPAVLARLKPRSITLEKERLYEDALSLKMEINLVKEENLKLRTRIQQMEKERVKREEAIEESRARDHYFGKNLQSQHLVTNLKLAIKDLKAELQTKEDELCTLRKNLKSTKVAEIEIEVQAYIDECTRLRHHLEEVMTTGMNPTIASYEQRLREQDEQLELFQRENDELKEALQASQTELQKWRERMLKRKPKKKGEVQHLKAELQKLRAQLDAREKKQARTAEITPKKKEPARRLSKGVQNTDIPLKPEVKPTSERQTEKARDLHNLPEQPKNVRFPDDTGRHPDLVIESFFGKISKTLLEAKLSLAVLLAYIYRSETGYCTAGELYTGLQTQGMAVDREEVEIVVRTLGDAGRLSSAQFQSAYKRFEAAKQSFSAYEDSSHSSPRADPVAPARPAVPAHKASPEKQKEAPSPAPVPAQETQKVTVDQAKPLMQHFSFRLQLQRVPKSKLFQTLFGSPFEKDSTVTLKELMEYLGRPPMAFRTDEGVILARFLLEPPSPPSTIKESEIKDLKAVAKDIVSRLSSAMEDWPVYSSDDEARFDSEISTALQRNKLAIKESCKSYDLSKSGIIKLQELLEIIKNLELNLSNEVIHYMSLLFYSHKQELNSVPYKEFIKAYTGREQEVGKRADSEPGFREEEAPFRPGEDEEEYEGNEENEAEEGEDEGDDLSENERAQIVRFYLEKIATFLKANRISPAELFEPEDGYVYPESLIQGLQQLPNVQLEKRDIMVFLEGLQAEEMDELCIAMDYLEQLLQHYGVEPAKASRPGSAKAAGNRSLDSPSHEKRVSLLDEESSARSGEEPVPAPKEASVSKVSKAPEERKQSPKRQQSPKRPESFTKEPSKEEKPPKRKDSSSSSKKSGRKSEEYGEDQFEEEEEQELELVLSPDVLGQYLKKYGTRISNLLKAENQSLRSWLRSKHTVTKDQFLAACEDIIGAPGDQEELGNLFRALEDDGKMEIEDLEDAFSRLVPGFFSG